MIEKCAEVIANWLIKNEVIDDENKELYSYAIYSFILSFSPLALAVCFGLCMGCVKQGILIVLPFMCIRKFSGGYHTQHLWSCLICSSGLLFMCMMLSLNVKCEWKLAVITLGAMLCLICFSPIENENRKLSVEEHKSYKKATVFLVILFAIIDVLLILCKMYEASVCISVGIILSAGLQIPCVVKRWVRYILDKVKFKELKNDQNRQKNVVSYKMD